MTPVRSAIRRCLLLGALGFGTTVVIAWGAAARNVFVDTHEHGEKLGTDEAPGFLDVLYMSTGSIGADRVSEHTIQPICIPVTSEPLTEPMFCEVPVWVRAAQGKRTSTPVNVLDEVQHIRAGFPARCLEGHRVASYQSTRVPVKVCKFDRTGSVFVIAIEDTGDNSLYDPEYGSATVLAFPIIPLWSGIALDTLAFGIGWWLSLAGLSAVRGRVRAGRGHCAACEYDLTGNSGPCPECGTMPVGTR